MKILKWWVLSTALHNRCNSFSIQWFGLVKNRKCRDFWALILGCVIWSLWYERNQIKFELKTPNLHNFVYSLKIRIGIWAKEMLGFSGFAPQNVIYNMDYIRFADVVLECNNKLLNVSVEMSYVYSYGV